MNTETGEIKAFKQDEPLSPPWVPLRQLADKNCPDCRGRGKHLRRRAGKRGGFYFEPCQCTQRTPSKQP